METSAMRNKIQTAAGDARTNEFHNTLNPKVRLSPSPLSSFFNARPLFLTNISAKKKRSPKYTRTTKRTNTPEILKRHTRRSSKGWAARDLKRGTGNPKLRQGNERRAAGKGSILSPALFLSSF
jgi:hypothetical protein